MSVAYLNTSGGKIAYELSGSGPLVICAPGLGDLRGEYRFLAPLLVEAGFRVAAVDLRGHGQSSTQWQDFSVAGIGADLAALARELGGPAFLLGTSMGAGAAVWAAAEAPDLWAGLVLLSPFVRGEAPAWMKPFYRLMFTRPWGPAAWVSYFGGLFSTRKPDDYPDYTARLRANLAEPGRIEAVLAMMLAPKHSSGERIPRVSAPALVVVGDKDPDFKDPVDMARGLAAELRGSYDVIAGAGHYPQVEFPEQTGPVIVRFLRSQLGEKRSGHVAQGRS